MNHLKRVQQIIALVFILSTLSCYGNKKNNSTTVAIKDSLFIMTFNVENLFDTKHDSGKVDYTFLPKSYKSQQKHIKGCNKISRKKWRDQCLYWDWSDKVLEEKLKRIADSIKQVNGGLGPDIIVLQEVENKSVLETLRTKHLQGLGYTESILVEGKDKRGIDVAFLSKLAPNGRAKLNFVPFKNVSQKRKSDTRGILQQDFQLPNGDIITGFAVHFPAPYHPHELRVQSYQYMNSLIEKLPKDRLAFAAGDFNTPTRENNKYNIWETHTASHWFLPHKSHCKNCPGTAYYAPKKSWSFLDTIFLSKSFANSHWKVKKVSIANKAPHQTTPKGRPNSFKLQGSKVYGVSDHWPMVVQLHKTQK